MDFFYDWFTSNLNSQTTWLKVKLKLVNFLNGTTNYHHILDVVDYFLAGVD